MGLEMKCACTVLVWKMCMKRKHGRSRHRWEENVTRYLKETGCELDAGGLELQSNGRTW